MSKGDAEHAAKHQHGVQVRQTGTVGKPVTEERLAALEARVKSLEERIKIDEPEA